MNALASASSVGCCGVVFGDRETLLPFVDDVDVDVDGDGAVSGFPLGNRKVVFFGRVGMLIVNSFASFSSIALAISTYPSLLFRQSSRLSL